MDELYIILYLFLGIYLDYLKVFALEYFLHF